MSDRPVLSVRWTDHRIEAILGRLLQVGVLISAAVVLGGGLALLWQHGGRPVDYHLFQIAALPLRSVSGVLRRALALDSQAVVQLGLLLLIATPVARVALMLIAFMLQRDRLYVLISSIVLALLLVGLFGSGG